MPRCFIGLGGNLGRVDETFERALELLRALPNVKVGAVSTFRRTFPVGENAGDPFLNAAAELSTTLPPAELIGQLQAVENECGRVRTVHWGPRTLDLDLLFYGSETVQEPKLIVPHPAVWYRRFVLDPLAQIATDFVHPIKGISVRHLRERLLVRPLPIAFAGASFAERQRLLALIGREFPDVWPIEWVPGQERPLDPRAEPKIVVWLGQSRLGARIAVENVGGSTGAGADAGQSFEALPFLPRVDATACSGSVLQFVRDILTSALGS
jgi:2-amino-4-hydroxy-6-hydroxymethyldihydropteridine diphosphokinase